MEVKMVAAVKHVQTIKYVLGCVAVYHIQQHCDAHTMRSVNELLEVVWETIPATCSEEAVDLVSETGIVGMLHDCHQLYSVVSQALDSWENILGELLVCSNLWLGRGYTNVSLIDSRTLGLWRALVLPHILLGRVPETRIVYGRDVQVLGYSGDPGREALLAGVVVGCYK